MHLYPINGACHDVGTEDTAFAYRTPTSPPSSCACGTTRLSTPNGSNGSAIITPDRPLFRTGWVRELHV